LYEGADSPVGALMEWIMGPHRDIGTKVITANGKRLVQVTMDIEDDPEGVVVWFQLDFMYRGGVAEEFKQKLVRTRFDEMERIIKAVKELTDALKESE